MGRSDWKRKWFYLDMIVTSSSLAKPNGQFLMMRRFLLPSPSVGDNFSLLIELQNVCNWGFAHASESQPLPSDTVNCCRASQLTSPLQICLTSNCKYSEKAYVLTVQDSTQWYITAHQPHIRCRVSHKNTADRD